MGGAIMPSLLLGVLAMSTHAAASPRVVKMPIAQKKDSSGSLHKRDPFAISMQNFIPYAEYFVTASIGTPAQEIELIVDTGSSDLWMFGTGSCTKGTPCEGGQFDSSKSTTFADAPGGKGTFQIQYQTQGSGVVGDYFTDVLSVGGVQVTNATMALATRAAQVPAGIMGIGLAVNEAGAGIRGGYPEYPNFPQLLVSQGKIASRAYSLYLDDISTATGTILFGGYDYDKFRGDLTMLPIQLDDQSGARTSFTVSWTSIGINTAQKDYSFEEQNFAFGAVLDTGTTLTYLPTEIYNNLAQYFEAQPAGGQQDLTLVDCNIGKGTPGQLVFGLGGENGVQIAVEFEELAVPIYSTRTGEQYALQNGQPACQFGLNDAGDSYSILFGQTFLRSAYVLYDLDNLQLGVAQTIFDATTTNVMEYNGNRTTGRIQSDESGPTVTYAPVSSSILPFGPGGGYGSLLGGYGSVGSAIGGLPGATGAVEVVSTNYDIPTFRYPMQTPPTAFPTVIPAGPTGKIGTGANADGSPFSAGQGSDGGSTNQQNSQNRAGLMTPTFATAGVLMLAVLSAMLML